MSGATKKPPSASATHQEHLVRPQHTNAHGTLFGGELLAWIDICAATCAMRHANRPVVTASIDAMHFFEPINLGYVVSIDAMVNYTSRTSCEVGVRVTAAQPVTGESSHTASAYLTFVALDDQGKPTPMAAVDPQTNPEKRRHREAAARRQSRLALKQEIAERRARDDT